MSAPDLEQGLVSVEKGASNSAKLTAFSSSSMSASELGATVVPHDGGDDDAAPSSPSTAKAKKSRKVQPPSFEDVLYGQQCPCTRREFREYLSTMRADEMIDFFETCENYVKVYPELIRRKVKPISTKEKPVHSVSEYDDYTSNSGIFETNNKSEHGSATSSGACKLERNMDVFDYASAIVTQFVVPDAPREINVSYSQRSKFLEMFKKYDHGTQPPVDLFDQLQQEMRSMLRGAFPRFLEYISTTNMSESHVFHRYKYGTVYLFVLIGILLAMVLTGISPLYRLIIITFWQGPLIMFASAYFRMCDGLARLGIRMTKEEWDVFRTIFKRRAAKENKLTNEWAKQKLLKRTTRMELATATLGLIIGICTLFIPPSITSI